MSAQVFEFTGGKLTPMTSQGLAIGQRVMQAHRGKRGVICEDHGHNYLVIFSDGSEAANQRLNQLSPFTRISIIEGIADKAEVESLQELRVLKREADRVAREEASKQHVTDTERIKHELQDKYPWAIPPGTLSDHARAAKNLRIELSQTFPGIKFSVRSSSFAGGNDVTISWTLGPTRKEVKAIADKYQDGHFDGMIDLYEYDRSAFGSAVDTVLGRAKYVSESRRFPEELHEQVGRDLCALQHVPYDGLRTSGLLGSGDRTDLQSHVNQLLGATSFAPNEKYQGVESIPNEERQSGHDWVRIIKSPSATITLPIPIASSTTPTIATI